MKGKMANVTLNVVYKEIKDLKSDITYLKYLLEERYELSDWAKNELKKAREEMESRSIPHKEIMKKYA